MKEHEATSGLFFGSLPNLEELIAAKAIIRQTNKNEEISTIQPLCCRELIFTEPKVLVSPFMEERNQLFLITPKATLESSQFQELLQRLNIECTEQVNLTKSMFQFCFSFTMKQKLAPLWNKAGEFLVQGRDFMLENSKLNAVTLQVTITDKICIGLQARSLKSTLCKPEHFTASVKALEEFNANNQARISDAAISDDLCFVLPSLKKGRIFSITHQLPEECPFSNYEELRKHWKLMYGYRLPPEENVFYNVHFYYIKGKIFTYPACCIRSSQVLVSPRCDHQLIFSLFLRDLSTRMPTVCGTPLTFTSSPLYPTSRLQHASHANHSNLTKRTPPQFNHCRPFTIQAHQTPEDSPRQAVRASPSATQLVSSQASSQIQSLTELNNAVIRPRTLPTATPFSCLSSTPFVPRFSSKRTVSSSSCELDRTPAGNSVHPTTGARIIPVFSRKRVQSHVKEQLAGNNKNGHKTAVTGGAAPRTTTDLSRVPLIYHAVHTQNGLSSNLSLTSSHVAGRKRMEDASEKDTTRLDRTLEDNRNSHTRDINGGPSQGIRENPSSQVWVTESLSQVWGTEPLTQNSPAAVLHRHDTSLARSPSSSSQVSKCLPETRPGLVITQAPINSNILVSPINNMTRDQWSAEDTFRFNLEQRSIRDANRLPIGQDNSPDLLFETFSTLISSRSDLTRKREINDLPNENTPSKKPKSKPKLQENIDVRELAIHDQLHKVNTVTLIDWLKKRGVPVKSKDKKADLASKVKEYLAMVPHEQ